MITKNDATIDVVFYGIFVNLFSLVVAAEAKHSLQPTSKLFQLISIHRYNSSNSTHSNNKAVIKIPTEIWELIQSYLIPSALAKARHLIFRDFRPDCRYVEVDDGEVYYDDDRPEAWEVCLDAVYNTDCCDGCLEGIERFIKRLYTPEQLSKYYRLLAPFDLKLVANRYIPRVEDRWDQGDFDGLQALTSIRNSELSPDISEFNDATLPTPSSNHFTKLENFLSTYQIELPDGRDYYWPEEEEDLVTHQGSSEKRWEEVRWILWIAKQIRKGPLRRRTHARRL